MFMTQSVLRCILLSTRSIYHMTQQGTAWSSYLSGKALMWHSSSLSGSFAWQELLSCDTAKVGLDPLAWQEYLLCNKVVLDPLLLQEDFSPNKIPPHVLMFNYLNDNGIYCLSITCSQYQKQRHSTLQQKVATVLTCVLSDPTWSHLNFMLISFTDW